MDIQKSFSNKKSTLYIVPTPIGNIKEMTPRAIDILKSVAKIYCEDTRVSIKLKNYFNILTPLQSCHEFNEHNITKKVIANLNNGQSIALISDAGHPLISDPGAYLIKEVIKAKYNIVPLSGPCAFLSALVASGFELNNFYFAGFLPRKQNQKLNYLNKLKEIKSILTFYESPKRVTKTLEYLKKVFGNIAINVTKELTKKHEEFIRGDINEIIEHMHKLSLIKGEYVIIIDNTRTYMPAISLKILATVDDLIKHMSLIQAIKITSHIYEINKNTLYKHYLNYKNTKQNLDE